MQELGTFTLIAFTTVFAVVDPIAVVPAFLAITGNESAAQKRSTAMRAAIASTLTLAVFALAGKLIFRFFGISLASFKISGGILLFFVAFEMMQAKQSRTKATPEEEAEGVEKADVAIIPLAIPLLSGPGAIATVMVLMSRHERWIFALPVFVAIFATGVITWLLLRGAAYVDRHMSRTAMNVLMRIMGMLLAAVAVEFLINGIKEAYRAG